MAERFPLPIWRCAAALLGSETGQQSAAQQQLDGLAAADFAALPSDGNWLPAMAVLAETCVALGDRNVGSRVAQQLAPYADRLVVIAQAVVCFGPVSYFLGRLAALRERWDEAVEHLSAALATASRVGGAMLIAQSQCALAAALIGESPEASPRAVDLATAALAIASARGLVRLQEQASVLLEGRRAAAPSPASSAAAVFRKDGEYWTVTFDGIEARLKDARGLTYIAYLLRHAGTEVHSLDLATMGSRASGIDRALQVGAAAELSIESDDPGPLLDPAAKQAYRRRLTDLREELDEATSFNDPGRAERAQAEIDAITRELAAAVGLGNRDRKTGSAVERSRVAVTKAILAALRTIAEINPSLRRYFSGTLKTGQFCSYTPDPRFSVSWVLD